MQGFEPQIFCRTLPLCYNGTCISQVGTIKILIYLVSKPLPSTKEPHCPGPTDATQVQLQMNTWIQHRIKESKMEKETRVTVATLTRVNKKLFYYLESYFTWKVLW